MAKIDNIVKIGRWKVKTDNASEFQQALDNLIILTSFAGYSHTIKLRYLTGSDFRYIELILRRLHYKIVIDFYFFIESSLLHKIECTYNASFGKKIYKDDFISELNKIAISIE